MNTHGAHIFEDPRRKGSKLDSARRGLVDMSGREFYDPNIEEIAQIAHDLNAKMYPGGWINLLNWAFPEQGTTPAQVNTFSLVASITSPAALRAFIPANSTGPGTLFHCHAWGIYQITSTPSTTMSIFANGAAGTSLAVTASMSPTASGAAPQNIWNMDAWGVVLTEGSGGTIQVAGTVQGLAAAIGTVVGMPATMPAAATWNSTQANSLNLCATFSASSVSNGYTTQLFTVEQLN